MPPERRRGPVRSSLDLPLDFYDFCVPSRPWKSVHNFAQTPYAVSPGYSQHNVFPFTSRATDSRQTAPITRQPRHLFTFHSL